MNETSSLILQTLLSNRLGGKFQKMANINIRQLIYISVPNFSLFLMFHFFNSRYLWRGQSCFRTFGEYTSKGEVFISRSISAYQRFRKRYLSAECRLTTKCISICSQNFKNISYFNYTKFDRCRNCDFYKQCNKQFEDN